MPRMSLWSVILGALIIPGACTRQDEPPPAFNEKMTDRSGRGLPPVVLSRHQVDGLPPVGPTRYLKKIEGPAGGGAEAETAGASGEPGGGGAPAIVLNDSDPNALMEQFVELAAAGNLEAISMMLVPEQQPVLKGLAAATRAIEAGLNRMQAALRDKDAALAEQFKAGADGMFTLAPPAPGEEPISVPADAGAFQNGNIENLTVNAVGDDNAEAVFREAGSSEQKRLDLARVDGKWRIKGLPTLPTGDAAAAQIATARAAGAALEEVAAKVENNEIQPANVIQEIFTAHKRLKESPEVTTATEGETPPNEAEPPTGQTAAPAPSPTPAPRSGRTRSGRDPNTEAPTLEEGLGRS